MTVGKRATPAPEGASESLFSSLGSIRHRLETGNTTLLAEEALALVDEIERWRERTRYLLTTDPSEWEPEVIRWLT